MQIRQRYYKFKYKGGQILITSEPKMTYYSSDLEELEVSYDPPLKSNGKLIKSETIKFNSGVAYGGTTNNQT